MKARGERGEDGQALTEDDGESATGRSAQNDHGLTRPGHAVCVRSEEKEEKRGGRRREGGESDWEKIHEHTLIDWRKH